LKRRSPPAVVVPRPVAIFLPPVLALVLAGIYHHWQAGRAADEAAALCARFATGDVKIFVQEALAADFTVHDEGAGSDVVIASKEVFSLRKEHYRCVVRHDGDRILSAETSTAVE